MEELKLLIDMVANLPQMALWVLCGFLVYKLAVVGSIYGVIRFTVQKFVEWRTYQPTPPPAQPKEFSLAGIAMSDEVAMAIASQLIRLSTYGRIHASDMKRLESVVDKVIAEKEGK